MLLGLTLWLDLRSSTRSQAPEVLSKLFRASADSPPIDGAIFQSNAEGEDEPNSSFTAAAALDVGSGSIWRGGRNVGRALASGIGTNPVALRSSIYEAIRRPEKYLAFFCADCGHDEAQSAKLFEFAFSNAQHCRGISGAETCLLYEVRDLDALSRLLEASRDNPACVPVGAMLPPDEALWTRARRMVHAAEVDDATEAGDKRVGEDEDEDEDDEDDEDDDNYDPYVAFRSLGTLSRWAPASKGSRWVQRDSEAALAVKELLGSGALLELKGRGMSINVESRLGEGRFGDVLLGTIVEDDDGSAQAREVAVKVALRPTSEFGLEAEVLESMCGVPGFPTLLCYQTPDSSASASSGGQSASWSELELIVMQRLGRSIQSVWETHISGRSGAERRFSEHTIAHIAHGVLSALKRLHVDAGYVHNDLKPANILLGLEGSEAEDAIYLVDFGSATPISALPSLSQQSEGTQGGRSKGSVVGSQLYASIAAHEGRQTSASSDIEAVVYLLAFLASGSLPWSGISYDRIGACKRKLLVEGWSPSAPPAVRLLWQEVVACYEDANRDVDYASLLTALEREVKAGIVLRLDWKPIS